MDRTPRLWAACTMYVLQNVAVASSAAAVLGASTLKGVSEAGFWACIVGAIGLGSLSSVGCQVCACGSAAAAVPATSGAGCNSQTYVLTRAVL